MTKKKALPYNGRDYNIIKIIKGATKSGVQKDKKKEQNKYASREDEKPLVCRQCGFPIHTSQEERSEHEQEGFCSESCFDYHTSGDYE